MIGVTSCIMKSTFRKLTLLSFALIAVSILISGCKRVVKDYEPWRVPESASHARLYPPAFA